MEEITELVITYLSRLKNLGMTSVIQAEISSYLTQIGIKRGDQILDHMIKNKILLKLQNGKVTLNKIKLRKKFKE